LIQRCEGPNRTRHRRIAPIALVRRVDDRRRRHHADFEVRNSFARKSKFHGGCTGNVKLALAPVWARIVDADDGGAAVVRIANEEDRAVGIDRACGAIGFVRPECLTRGGQAAGIEAIASAIIIVGSLENLVVTDDGYHFRDA
jgi:hypothetical protein